MTTPPKRTQVDATVDDMRIEIVIQDGAVQSARVTPARDRQLELLSPPRQLAVVAPPPPPPEPDVVLPRAHYTRQRDGAAMTKTAFAAPPTFVALLGEHTRKMTRNERHEWIERSLRAAIEAERGRDWVETKTKRLEALWSER